MGLAIVCDDYLVMSLEQVCERLEVREDVAGATFMAFGSAAPEIVVNAVTTIKQAASTTHGPSSDQPSIGVGAIIGSGIIAFLLIPGVCALAVTDDIQLRLKRRPLLRDVGTYAVSLGLLCIFFHDGVIEFYEAATLVALYGVYVVVVVCAPKVRRVFRVHILGKKHKAHISFIQQAKNREAAAVLLRTSLLDNAINGGSEGSPSGGSGTSPQEHTSLLSNNYGTGNTSTTTALHTQTSSALGSTQASYSATMTGPLASTSEIMRYDMVSNAQDLPIVAEDIDALKERQGRQKERRDSFVGHVGGVEEEGEGEGDGEEENETSTCMGRWIWTAAWPLRMLFALTCPNCEEGSEWVNWYPITFMVSFVWVAFFSFIISTVVERWVHLGLSNHSSLGGEWFGLVLISIGAEIPDAIQSITVARRGYGSMAVSNAIGSQIINILIGLGLPWMITNLIPGNCVRLYAHKALQYAALFQFAIVGTFLALLLGAALIFKQNKAILSKTKARFLMSLYFVVLVGFTLVELYGKPPIAKSLQCKS